MIQPHRLSADAPYVPGAAAVLLENSACSCAYLSYERQHLGPPKNAPRRIGLRCAMAAAACRRWGHAAPQYDAPIRSRRASQQHQQPSLQGDVR